jgi:hypothetical protein
LTGEKLGRIAATPTSKRRVAAKQLDILSCSLRPSHLAIGSAAMADGVKKPFKFSQELQSAIQDDFKRQVRCCCQRHRGRSNAAPAG